MSQTIDFGIDLGTTNSSIALCRRGEVRVFQSTDLMNVTPSVVYVSRTGRMLVGKKAYDTWVADPANTQAEFKRWMGYSDQLAFPASGKNMSAEALSAEVLKALRADAERQTQEQVTSAVITVPAAFGSLQCDATGRAAALAGLTHAPLLQEPVAAAIAAGASANARDQRWLVFDLGGGTLDIAVVSTRHGRLAVLDHQGNNRLGGKDIDRVIADEFILKRLAEQYRLSDDPTGRFKRAIVRCAEQAKIALSTAEETVAEVFDVGDDADGQPIEAPITLRRADVEQAVGPIMEQCLDLVRRALAGARMTAAELDRVVLVGGPTQMPIVRAALKYELGDKLDASLDPMTVVSHGAALFASTLDRPGAAAEKPKPVVRGTVAVQLAYERASGTPQSPVAGAFDEASGVHEVKVDAGGGFWTSGWVPTAAGQFAVDVMLNPSRPATRFTLSARTAGGQAVNIDPAEFTVASLLPMTAAPLPHTIAVELSGADGQVRFDPIFKRHTPLPAEARRTYKADRTLRPSEVDAALPVKFWEVDVSDDPQEKWWAGCVKIGSGRVRRPILEGSDLELTVKIDASRKMSVELFVPMLNESIAEDVYVPDPPAAGAYLQQELNACFDRLDRVRSALYQIDVDDEDFDPGVVCDKLQRMAEDLAERAAADRAKGMADPDAMLATTDGVRKLRMQLTQLEERLNLDSTGSAMQRKLRDNLPYLEGVLGDHGTPSQQEEFMRLVGQMDKYKTAGDARGLKWVHDEMWGLHRIVLHDKAWHWQGVLRRLRAPGQRFVNQTAAEALLAEAEAAQAKGDLGGLRAAVQKAWDLRPPDAVEDAVARDAQSGLRGG